ncbi:DNA polymerase III delta prime subunit [Cutibacterium acnes JCM 18909]|nr:DNA polymerase III delta prime subunit [Cutibacterium acnes JCM 18909]
MLKAIEEPAPKTVWLLCAPTPEDVIVTIRSRCRRLHLATPRDEAVADLLTRRDGVAPEVAAEVPALVKAYRAGAAPGLGRGGSCATQRHW